MALPGPDARRSVRTTTATTTVVVAGCLVAAAVSLPLRGSLGFDPWAWLVWGREVGDLDLDTTGGPSWKPLPVAFTTLFAPFDSLAPTLWMVTARAGTLLALVAAYRLAARFAGVGAGLVAAGLLLLTPDADPRFLRLFLEGHAAPWSAALLLLAIDRHLERRHATTLLLVTAAGLLRPEVWPFLGLYALWLWPRQRSLRLVTGLAIGCIPLLWFGMDWWGSGSPLHGADAAQVAASDALSTRVAEGASVVLSMVAMPVWAAAAFCLWDRRASDDAPALGSLAVVAAAWIALVVTMAVALGYAALSRFLLPAAAVVCVLAGIGVVRAVRLFGSRRALVAGAASVALVLLAPRVVGLIAVLDEAIDRVGVEDDLDRVLAEVPDEVLFACADIAVEAAGLLRPAVAWKLHLSLDEVPTDLVDGTGVMIVRTDGRRDLAISRQDHTEPLLRSAEWSVLAVRCPAASATALPDT